MRLSTTAIIAVTWDVLVVTVLGIIAGTDALREYVSTIGQAGAPTKNAYVLAGTIALAIHVALAVPIWQRTKHLAGGHIAAGLLSSFFLLQWLNAALFPCDPGCDLITWTGRTHYTLSVIAFVAFGLSVIAYTLVVRTRLLIITGSVAVALALALLAADRLDILSGLFERLSLVGFGAWLIALAASQEGRTTPESPRAPSEA